MSDKATPFDFSQFVPGFDFLKNLAAPLAAGASTGAGAGAAPGMPSLSSWVAPTLSVEEVDKRIKELKTVQYWLEQNGHALKATIQALEVQKMTLSTLRGMNVRMEDLAKSFARAAPKPVDADPAPAGRSAVPQPPAETEEQRDDEVEDEAQEHAAPAEAAPPPAPKRAAAGKKASAGASAAAPDVGKVVDPMQWWGALTQQFQHIASAALADAGKLGTAPDATKKRAARAATTGAASQKGTKKPAARKSSKTSARKAAASKRGSGRAR